MPQFYIMGGMDISAIEGEVDGMLSRSLPYDAMVLALENAPFAVKDADVKAKFHEFVMRAVSTISDSSISETVDKLHDKNPSLCDNLMKYVYRGLKNAENCGSLLKWHAAITKKCGLAPVVRAMTDRKTA